MWRVEVEESRRLTRSKLLSISPTIVLRPLALESMAGMDGSGGGRGSNERCPEKMMICKLYW